MDKLKQNSFIKDLDDNISKLDEIKELFNKIDLEIKNLNSFILVYINNMLINLKELQKLFNAFIKINENVKNEKQNCLESIKHKMNLYFEQISELLENQNFIKIKELNNQLLDIINKKFINEIEKSECNLTSSNNFINSYNKYWDNYNSENNNNSIFCSTTQAFEAQFICKEGKSLCKNCYNNKNNINENNHESQNKKENISEKEIEKENFLNSLKNIIKSILIRSNILYNEKEPNIGTNIKNNKTIQRLSFKYPSIDNINDFDSQIKFLKDINNILINDFCQTNINLNSFTNTQINENILNKIQYFNFENSSEEISEISNISFTEDDYGNKIFNILHSQYEEEDNKSKNIAKENWLSISHLEIIFKKSLYSVCGLRLGIIFEFINGFFCNINYKKGVIPTLFTAYLNGNFNKIELFLYNNKYKLNLKNSKRIIYSSKKNNISIIELKKDEIQSSFSFFELDMSLILSEKKNDFKQRKIYCLYYSNSIKEFCVSIGLGQYIKKHVLYHTCPTNDFSKGAPIIDFINNKIIGINFDNRNNTKINKARLLKDSIKNFISKINLNYN